MTVRFTDAFKRQLERLSRRYRRIRADVQPIIDRLVAGETPGNRIQAGQHILYKVRVKNTDAGRGTRGGFRIIYYLLDADDVLLLTIYSKSDQGDISVAELRRMIADEDHRTP